jgi:hypothetical protein
MLTLKEAALKALTPLTILIEAYRVFNGTLLVIFVPGVCGDKACLPQENFMHGSMLYRINCGLNLVTLVAFILLYSVEVRREYKITAYLRINPELPSNTMTVKAAFDKLTVDRQEKIHSFDALYKRVVTLTLFMFVMNTLLSGYVILTEYANDKGPILFATGTVLIANKIYTIMSISNYDGYVSAYLQKRLEFNDVQPGKAIVPV